MDLVTVLYNPLNVLFVAGAGYTFQWFVSHRRDHRERMRQLEIERVQQELDHRLQLEEMRILEQAAVHLSYDQLKEALAAAREPRTEWEEIEG